jgi:RimJ/RimL family protein N-acetyltransferase
METHAFAGIEPRTRLPSLEERPIVVRAGPLTEREWENVRAFVRSLHRDDIRNRFGHPVDLADEPTLRRFFDVNRFQGDIAWVTDDGGAIAGIAHRIRLSPTEAEIGLIVRSDLKRRGIGELLLRDLLARSVRDGLQTLDAFVLRENRAMLGLAAKAGEKVSHMIRRSFAGTMIELTFELAQWPTERAWALGH